MLRLLFLLILPTLPLGPHYRAGKYLPVLTTAPTILAVPGCTNTVTTAAPQFSPLFMRDDAITQLTAADPATRESTTLPLAPLSDTELLIATDTTPPDLSSLFPNQHLLILPLTPWQLARCAHAADAVYTDHPADLPDTTFPAGTTIITPTPPPPDSPLPWRHDPQSNLYLATPPHPPPTTDPAAYATAPWPRGASPATRHNLPLFATLFALAALATTLLPRRALLALTTLSLATLLALVLYARRQPPARILARLTSFATLQEQSLTITPAPGRPASIPWSPNLWPLTPTPDATLALRDHQINIPTPQAFTRRTLPPRPRQTSDPPIPLLH